MDDTNDRFLQLLNRISQRANNDHIRTAKFLLREKITRKQMEQCTDMRDLFDKLITKGFITPENIEIVKVLTSQVFNDCDIDKMIQQYERGERSEKVPHTGKERTSVQSQSISSVSSEVRAVTDTKISTKFKKIFEYTAKHLGEDWKVLARLIGMPEHDVENISLQQEGESSKAMKVMEIWFGSQTRPSSRDFKKLLRRIPRNDIADDLQEHSTNH